MTQTPARNRLKQALVDAVEPSLRRGPDLLEAWEVEEEVRALWRWLTRRHDTSRPKSCGSDGKVTK